MDRHTKTMRKALLSLALAAVMLFGTALQASAAIPAISRSKYIKTYLLSGKIGVYTSSSLRKRGTSSPSRTYNASIYSSDEIRVYKMTDSYSYISYPSNSGRRYGYIPTSAITSNNHSQGAKTSKAKITTYKRAGGASYGYIAKGDLVYTTAQSGNYTQVIYPAGSHYKMGWISTSSYNRYVNTGGSTSSGHNPMGYLESVECMSNDTITVQGWVFDQDDLNRSLDIHIYIGGPAGSTEAVYGVKADKYRADVNQAYPGVGYYHGFSSTINVRQTGAQSVYVYAINTGAGSNTLLGQKTVRIKSTNPVNSASRPVADGMYKLVSAVNSRYVWDIDSGSLADGANLQLYEDNESNAQKFIFTYDSDGYYIIKNVNSGKAVDCAGGGTEDGTNVCQFASNNTPAQRWKLIPAGNSSFTFSSKCSGKVMDVADGIATNKRNIQIYQSNDSSAQKFKLVETTRKTETVNNNPSPAPGNVSYAPYTGVSYTNRGLSTARVAALDKAKQMVTIQWTAPCDFPTWASSKGIFNRAVATDGTSNTKFVKGKTYTGVPYSMTNHSYNDIAWAALLKKGITTSSMTGRMSGYPVSGTARGIDCSYFVYEAIKSAVGSGRISYERTSKMLNSGTYKKISLSSMKPGDLFLKSGHVMMYVGLSGSRYAVFEADAGDSKCSYNTYTQSYIINNYKCYRYKGFND